MAQNVKTVCGVAIASVKTVQGVAIASVKSILGVDNTGGGGGTSYLVKQGFEGTGFDNGETWTKSGGTVNEDYTGIVLEGSQSLLIQAAAATAYAYADFAAQTTCEAYFLFRIETWPSTERFICKITDSGGTNTLASVGINATGKLSIRSGASLAVTTDAVTVSTLTHVWVHYTKGAGANAVGTVAFSTDGTKPGSGNAFQQVTNSTATTDATRIQIGTSNTGTITFVADKIRVNPTIGSNPD